MEELYDELNERIKSSDIIADIVLFWTDVLSRVFMNTSSVLQTWTFQKVILVILNFWVSVYDWYRNYEMGILVLHKGTHLDYLLVNRTGLNVIYISVWKSQKECETEKKCEKMVSLSIVPVPRWDWGSSS